MPAEHIGSLSRTKILSSPFELNVAERHIPRDSRVALSYWSSAADTAPGPRSY
jgi:hypothetical protein